jgi:hypothetical protein
MRMLVSVEFADAGTKTGIHRVLVVGGCSDTNEPGDIGMSLKEAKTLLSALQWEFVAAQAAEITEKARRCELCGARLSIKDWARRSVQTLFGNVLIQAPRLMSCSCNGCPPRAISPLMGWLARTRESIQIRGVLRCLRFVTGAIHVGIPTLKRRSQIVIQHVNPDLQ